MKQLCSSNKTFVLLDILFGFAECPHDGLSSLLSLEECNWSVVLFFLHYSTLETVLCVCVCMKCHGDLQLLKHSTNIDTNNHATVQIRDDRFSLLWCLVWTNTEVLGLYLHYIMDWITAKWLAYFVYCIWAGVPNKTPSKYIIVFSKEKASAVKLDRNSTNSIQITAHKYFVMIIYWL